MATRDLPCAGCGQLMARVARSLPAGEAMCRPCRNLREAMCPQRPPRKWRRYGRPVTCPTCDATFTSVRKSSGYWTKTCSRSCGNYYRMGKTSLGKMEKRPDGVTQAEWDKARGRQKTHRRRERTQISDVTPAYETTLRRKVRTCPLCGVRLMIKPYLPASKELDHIVPLCIGGTHTIGNVRIICRRCNQARPKDGSDITGQLTLWAQADGIVPTRTAKAAERICECGRQKVKAPSGRWRCYECQPLWRDGLTTDERAERARRAADLRRHTDLPWQAIAMQLGYSSGQAAYAAAVHRARADGEYNFGRPYATASRQVSA